jgi:hypothetical protein
MVKQLYHWTMGGSNVNLLDITISSKEKSAMKYGRNPISVSTINTNEPNMVGLNL